MIPAHVLATGALPPGRYGASVEEIQNRFVLDDEFAASLTRVQNWAGFLEYLQAWDDAEAGVDQKVLIGLWIAGSFITNKRDPGDIDVTPIYDAAVVETLAGRPGVGRFHALLGDRQRLKRHFNVESFPLGWRSTGSSLFPDKLPGSEQAYLLAAGGLTDFWQREKRMDAAGGVLPSNQYVYKGFLEVLR